MPPPRCSGHGACAVHHPGGNPGANLHSISHRRHPILVAFVWELTRETIDLTLGCLQGGMSMDSSLGYDGRDAARRRRSPEEVLQRRTSHDAIVAPPPPVLVILFSKLLHD